LENVLSSFGEDKENDDETENGHAIEEENVEEVEEEENKESNTIWVHSWG